MEFIKKILNENKSLKILIPVLLVALIVLPIMYLNQPKKETTSGVPIVSTPPKNPQNSNNIPTTTGNPMAANPTSIPGELDTDFSSSDGESSGSDNNVDSSLIGPPEYKGSISGTKGTYVLLQFSNVTKHIKVGESIGGYILKGVSDDGTNITLEKNDIVSVLQISPNSIKTN